MKRKLTVALTFLIIFSGLGTSFALTSSSDDGYCAVRQKDRSAMQSFKDDQHCSVQGVQLAYLRRNCWSFFFLVFVCVISAPSSACVFLAVVTALTESSQKKK